MGKPETSIELAKTHFSKKKWREMKPSKRAALAILQDCLDRRGIKWEFEKCDPDIIESIVESWDEIIAKSYEREPVDTPSVEHGRKTPTQGE